MSDFTFTRADLERLRQWDTATICNALEVLQPQRRHIGYTVERTHVVHPQLPTVVGVARTATVRTREPARAPAPSQADYYDHIESNDWPVIAVVQDIDDRPGYGAFVGDISVAVHKALGVVGIITNGAARDTRAMDPAFQVLCDRLGPSHANYHVVGLGGEVKVFGMLVAPGDIVAADYQGAVVIPHEAVLQLPRAIASILESERARLEFVRSPGFSAAANRRGAGTRQS